MPIHWVYDTIPSISYDLTITSDSNPLQKYVCTNKTPGKRVPGVKQVYFNEKSGHTCVVWDDGTSTVVHCGEGEKFERYLGFCAAVMKKLYGSTSAAKKLMDDKDAELAKARKEEERQRLAEERRKEEAENRERKTQRNAKLLKELQEAMKALFAEEDEE